MALAVVAAVAASAVYSVYSTSCDAVCVSPSTLLEIIFPCHAFAIFDCEIPSVSSASCRTRQAIAALCCIENELSSEDAATKSVVKAWAEGFRPMDFMYASTSLADSTSPCARQP
eukprot:3645789-Pleurochrysis_carterae.AAC.3